MHLTADFYKDAQACIEQVVRDFRPQILDNYGKVNYEIKDDHTPVTELDRQLEIKLREALAKFDPTIGFEGEEFGKEGSPDTFWLIDPIDGTESFLRGIPFCRNVVTLVDNNRAVFAFVYKTITDDLFVASEGNGAFKNGLPVSVSSRPIERCWIDLAAKQLHDSASILEALSGVVGGFKIIGDFTLAIESKVDAMLLHRAGGGPWDYAPRALLFKEAGGRTENLDSSDYNFRNNNALFAPPQIFDQLKSVINGAVNEH